MAEPSFQGGLGSINTVFSHPPLTGPPGPKKAQGPFKPKVSTAKAKAPTKTRGPYRPRGQPKQLPTRARAHIPHLNNPPSLLGPPGPPSPTSAARSQPLRPQTPPGPARVEIRASLPTQNSVSSPIMTQSLNTEDQRAFANFGASMGEEYTMLYYRPSLQESYGQEAENNQTIFYPQTGRVEQYPGLLDPGYQTFISRAPVLHYNQTNVKGGNFRREIISERDSTQMKSYSLTQSRVENSLVQGSTSSFVEANLASSSLPRKPLKTALPDPHSLELDKQFPSNQPEHLIQMCSGFGHQDCFLGQEDFSDFYIIEKGLVSSEEEGPAKDDDLLSTPPMWRKSGPSKDWQKETRGRIEEVRIRLKLDLWQESKAVERAAAVMEKTDESKEEQLMEETVEEGVEETMQEVDMKREELREEQG